MTDPSPQPRAHVINEEEKKVHHSPMLRKSQRGFSPDAARGACDRMG